MEPGKLVFAQLMDFLPRHDFDACVNRYNGNRRPRGFSCRDQFLCLTFAQLTFRESLRDIETCLRAFQSKRYHAGFRPENREPQTQGVQRAARSFSELIQPTNRDPLGHATTPQ